MTRATEYMTRLSTRDINAADPRPDSGTLRDRCTAYVLQHIEHASPYHVEDLMDLVRDEVSRDVAQEAGDCEKIAQDCDAEMARLSGIIIDQMNELFHGLPWSDELPETPPPCPQCEAATEHWFSYCAMCGYHIAGGSLVSSPSGETP